MRQTAWSRRDSRGTSSHWDTSLDDYSVDRIDRVVPRFFVIFPRYYFLPAEVDYEEITIATLYVGESRDFPRCVGPRYAIPRTFTPDCSPRERSTPRWPCRSSACSDAPTYGDLSRRCISATRSQMRYISAAARGSVTNRIFKPRSAREGRSKSIRSVLLNFASVESRARTAMRRNTSLVIVFRSR